MRLLIKNGRVIDPAGGRDGRLDVLIDGGRIAAVEAGLIPGEPCRVIDAAGLVVCPGFIDLHVHLRQPGQEYKETIRTGSLAAAAGGFTSIACMPNTQPPMDNESIVEFVVSTALREAVVNVYPVGAMTKGRKGEELAEMGEMKAAGIVAVSDDGTPLASSQVMRRAMEYARMLELPVVNHAEDSSLSPRGVMNEGFTSTRLGLAGMHPAGEEIMVVRDIILAEATGAALHVPHLSTRGALARVRQAKERGLLVTCEATPHHLTLTEAAVEGFDTQAKMNPPLRSAEDVEALLRGLADGTIDCIATDHAPHHQDEKDLEFDNAPFGIIGLETAVSLALDRLVHRGVIDLPQMVRLFTTGPARVFRLEKGTLALGADADLTLLDPQRRVTIDRESMLSLSRNTPFHGLELQGAPVMTIVGGDVVWERG